MLFLVPRFDQPRYVMLRGTAFVICGLLSGIPLFHLEFFTEELYLRDFMTFPWALGGGIYIAGAVLYVFRIPERFKPGFFDIIVSQCQIINRGNRTTCSTSSLWLRH